MPPATHAQRLPSSTTPDRYELTIAPDLTTATFTGTARIELTVHEATDELICNAADLTIGAAHIESADGRIHDTEVTLDADAEQARFSLRAALTPGAATLVVSFTGELNDRLRGFYRSTFTDDHGAEQTIAVTQFEATDARRAFPCWDEPAFKAVFAVRLEIDDSLLAVSNGPELAREPMGDGRVRITFADTMPMSTYLVAFVVGPLEATAPVDVDGTPLRIVHRPGQGHLATFALDVGAFALRYFADYYGIVYPAEKMDMVAVPDFAFGAMENLGCVTYRETYLLVDPATATQSELMAVVDVIAHELAHMWFGDLVTMSWWNGIWLNEAFATFMEMKCTDAYRPEWHRWMHFGRERSRAFDTDALQATRAIEFPVHSPEDAEGMFDVLTYQKGSAVVRMLERFVGEDAFRDGIRRYLQTHQFGNTETGDLWDALEAETGEPVRAMMDSWIFQGGHPLVTVEPAPEGRVDLGQQIFRYDGTSDGTEWHVPLMVRHGEHETRMVLDSPSTTIDVSHSSWCMANAGGHGVYRVAYDSAIRDALFARVHELVPLERYSVLDDALALCLRGDLRGSAVAGLVRHLAHGGEDDLSIWQLAAEALETLDATVPDPSRDRWAQWRRETLEPVWSALGRDVADGDDDRRRALRGVILALVGRSGDADVVEWSREVFHRSAADPGSVDPGIASGALHVAAEHADAATFDTILDRFRHGATPQEQYRHLYAAARVSDPAVFERYLDLVVGDEVRSQNLAFAGRAALQNRSNGHRAWAVIRDRWDDLLARLPFNSINRLVEGIEAIDDPAMAAEVDAFFTDHRVERAERSIAQHVERMHVAVGLRTREADRLVDELR